MRTANANPLGSMVGALTAGAAIGAILPLTRSERHFLGSVSHTIADAAGSAANPAIEAGREQAIEIKQAAMEKVGAAVVQAIIKGDA